MESRNRDQEKLCLVQIVHPKLALGSTAVLIICRSVLCADDALQGAPSLRSELKMTFDCVELVHGPEELNQALWDVYCMAKGHSHKGHLHLHVVTYNGVSGPLASPPTEAPDLREVLGALPRMHI